MWHSTCAPFCIHISSLALCMRENHAWRCAAAQRHLISAGFCRLASAPSVIMFSIRISFLFCLISCAASQPMFPDGVAAIMNSMSARQASIMSSAGDDAGKVKELARGGSASIQAGLVQEAAGRDLQQAPLLTKSVNNDVSACVCVCVCAVTGRLCQRACPRVEVRLRRGLSAGHDRVPARLDPEPGAVSLPQGTRARVQQRCRPRRQAPVSLPTVTMDSAQQPI